MNYLSNICGVEVSQLHLWIRIFWRKFNLYGEAQRCGICRKFCPWVQTANTKPVVLPTLLPPEEMVPGKTQEFLCNPPQFSLQFCLSHTAIPKTRGGTQLLYTVCVIKSRMFRGLCQLCKCRTESPLFCFWKGTVLCFSGLHVLKCSEPVDGLGQRWAVNDQLWGKRDVKVL